MTSGIWSPPEQRLWVEYLDNEAVNFGPSDASGRVKANAKAMGVIDDAMSVGWSWYSRFPSNCFFSLQQESRHNTRLVPGLTHIRVWYADPSIGYGPVLVFAGRLGDPDESSEDVVWTAWSYLTELALSRTGYQVKYPNKLIGTELVQKEWERNDNKGKFVKYGATVQDNGLSRHINTGTIQNPWMADGSTPAKTDKQFQVVDVPRLLFFYDMTEMARANTTFNVTMGITRTLAPEFFFLRDAGSAITGQALRFPGNVIDFRRVPGVLNVRNDLATVATSKKETPLEIVDTVGTGQYGFNLFGRRQDTFAIKTLVGYKNINDITGGAVQSVQKKILGRALKEATQPTKAIRLDVRADAFPPFRGWDIEDTIKVELKKGRTAVNERFRLVGIRGWQDSGGYHQQLYIARPVT